MYCQKNKQTNKTKQTKHSHILDVWKKFKMKSLGHYYNLYLNTDVLLLADSFEKFLNTSLEYCGLDLCHYFSSPGLNCNVMLKMTGTESELISDIGKHLFIEKDLFKTFNLLKYYLKYNLLNKTIYLFIYLFIGILLDDIVKQIINT